MRISKLPTEFGDLELSIEPRPGACLIGYRFKLAPNGYQAERRLKEIVVNARTPQGRKLTGVQINGDPHEYFTNDLVLIAHPARNKEYWLRLWLGGEVHNSHSRRERVGDAGRSEVPL